MIIAAIEICLRMEGTRSLKDKRSILRRVIERVRHDFHVSIAEVADHELWGTASLGIAYVTNDAAHAESVLDHLLSSLDENPEFTVDITAREVLRI